MNDIWLLVPEKFLTYDTAYPKKANWDERRKKIWFDLPKPKSNDSEKDF